MLSPTPWPSPTWYPFPSASLRVSKIASFGHSGRQAPREMHSSVISSAMTLASFSPQWGPTRLTRPLRHDHSGMTQRTRYSSPLLFSKSTQPDSLRRPRFLVIMGLWAQKCKYRRAGFLDGCHAGNGLRAEEKTDHYARLVSRSPHECLSLPRRSEGVQYYHRHVSERPRTRDRSGRYTRETSVRSRVPRGIAS